MNRTKGISALFLIACTVLSACGTASTGAKTWIDKPRDGSTLPLGPVSIMAHAADSDGVRSIEFYVNGQLMQSVTPNYEEGANTRFGYAEWEFTPAGPGTYRIEVSAIDAGGNAGSPAIASVTISGEAEPAPPEEVPVEPEPAETEEPPVEEAPQEPPPEAPAPSQEVTVSFYADPASVQAGSGCATLHWDVEGTEQVYWNGTAVYFRGMEERCNLCEAETHKLQVVKTDGSSEDHWVTINVNGSCSAPPADQPPDEPPPAEVIPLEPIEVDTEGPTIHQVGADPDKIAIGSISCGSLKNTTRVWAVLYDESGIGEATAYWNIGSSENGVLPLQEGWLGWYGDIGPVNTAGTMNIYIYTEDVNGFPFQSNNFSVTVYDACID
jgi:hypothetical protein